MGMTQEIETTPTQSGVQRARPKRTIERQATDKTTGVILDLSWEEEVVPRRRPPEDKSEDPFLLAYPEALGAVMPSQKWQILMVLLEEWPVGRRRFRFSTTDIATRLGITVPYTSQLLKELETDGVITRHPIRQVEINPELFWKGKPKDRRQALYARSKGL